MQYDHRGDMSRARLYRARGVLLALDHRAVGRSRFPGA